MHAEPTLLFVFCGCARVRVYAPFLSSPFSVRFLFAILPGTKRTEREIHKLQRERSKPRGGTIRSTWTPFVFKNQAAEYVFVFAILPMCLETHTHTHCLPS